MWKQFAELGLLGLPFAEADGGMGAGPVETMVVMTELGRAPCTRAVLGWCSDPRWVDLLHSVRQVNGRDSLPALSDGTTLSAFAHTEPGTRWPVAHCHDHCSRRRDRGGRSPASRTRSCRATARTS